MHYSLHFMSGLAACQSPIASIGGPRRPVARPRASCRTFGPSCSLSEASSKLRLRR